MSSLTSRKFLQMMSTLMKTYLLPDWMSAGFRSPTFRWANSFSHGEPSYP